MRKDVQEQLLTFLDFIYAAVFALAVEKAFEVLIPESNPKPIPERIRLILLVVTIFYFLAWDWILGRLLTLKNPFKGYSRFLLEGSIAICAYAALYCAVHGRVVFLLFISLILALGGLFAKRTQKEMRDSKDMRELCLIQCLQFPAAAAWLIFFFCWHFTVEENISWVFTSIVLVSHWCFIFVYEMIVPRCIGMAAGIGVPFIPRSRLRNWRRKLVSMVS